MCKLFTPTSSFKYIETNIDDKVRETVRLIMNQSTSYLAVLTLGSASPKEDAVCLREVLSFTDHMEDESRQTGSGSGRKSISAVSLVCAVTRTLLFLVPPDASSNSVVYCLSDETVRQTIEQATASDISPARLQAREINEKLVVAELVLPSTSRILLVTSQVLQSSEARNVVIEWISSQDRNGFNSGSSPSVSSSRTPLFRSLQATLMSKDGSAPTAFPLNAKEPVPFETDLFKGNILCIIRPANPSTDDPYWNERVFAHKKRRLVINVQGKFKYQPTGVLYAGAEISKPMKLGLVTRALAGVLLKLVDRFVSGVHSAFGDENEQAHIVAPALGFFERIVVTPPSDTPPRIDEEIVESAESMAYRKSAKSLGNWNTQDTYTFSFYSMNIDLPTWSLVGLPVSGDVSLTTFWGDSALKICMYEKLGSERQHRAELKRYGFALQVSYLGVDTQASQDIDEEEEDILRWSGRDLIGPDVMSNSLLRHSESQVFDVLLHEDGDESDAESLFYDAEQPNPHVDFDQAQRIPSLGMEILSAIDRSCPAWIEILSSRGGYTKAFVVNINGTTMLRSNDDCNDLLEGSAVTTLVDKAFSPRLSTTERLRRMIGWAVTKPLEAGIASTNLDVFQQRRRIFSNEFARDDITQMAEKDKVQIKLSGLIFRAMSDRHWIHEWVKLTAQGITFYHPDKRKPSFHMTLASIVEVARLQAEECPILPGQFFLTLRSIGRSVYLMFGSERDRERFISETLRLKVVEGGVEPACSVDSDSTTASRLAQIGNPADEFMHKSSMWNCQRRRILNCGKFNFRHSRASLDPLRLVEDALYQALEPQGPEEIEQRRSFLDAAALLKQADVHDLSEKAKLVFFLNLYHLMIMHAYLILGPPDWSLKWLSYFNSIAYEVSDDIFSLVELEHCILRSNMSHPSQFMSRFVIPRSQYDFSLETQDFRINFALNCGALSNPSAVLVYSVEKLDDQLQLASRMYLVTATVTRKSGRKIILELPRICEWYFADFGNSEEDMLLRIEPYLRHESRKLLRSCWSHELGAYDMQLISIRYQSYSYECRPLQLVKA